MAYAQWVSINIQSKNLTVTLKNVVHQWGKFYQGSKDNEISPGAIDGTQIAAKTSYTLAGCGREDAASGIEGSFDLYDGDTCIGHVYFECPWGSKSNTATVTMDNADDYIVQMSGANLNSGALGNITLVVAKF